MFKSAAAQKLFVWNPLELRSPVPIITPDADVTVMSKDDDPAGGRAARWFLPRRIWARSKTLRQQLAIKFAASIHNEDRAIS